MNCCRLLSIVDILLFSLLISQLVGQTRDRARNFCESTLLVVLDPQVWEQVLYVIRLYPFGWMVVNLVGFATLESASLLRDLLLDKLVNFSLQVVLLIDDCLLNQRDIFLRGLVCVGTLVFGCG